MLAITRQNTILEMLRRNQSVNVTELAETFGVANETIRRDFKKLEESGSLKRTHGGAYITDGVMNDIDVSTRAIIRQEEKEIIAQKCAPLINTGDSIFLDSSTTAWFVAKELVSKHITVLTDSLKIANIFSGSSSVKLILVGGTYSSKTMSFFGSRTVDELSRYYVDKAILSCRTVSMEYGVTDSNENISMVRRTVLNRCRNAYLVVDNSKLDGVSFIHICNLEDFDAIICDQQLSPTWQRYLKSIDVESI